MKSNKQYEINKQYLYLGILRQLHTDVGTADENALEGARKSRSKRDEARGREGGRVREKERERRREKDLEIGRRPGREGMHLKDSSSSSSPSSSWQIDKGADGRVTQKSLTGGGNKKSFMVAKVAHRSGKSDAHLQLTSDK